MALADGVEAIVLRATEAIADHRPAAPIASQIAQGGSLSYGRFLAWRNMVTVEPPNRPAPARPSSSAASRGSDWKYRFTVAVGVEVGEASAANRRTDWKYGFTGSRDRSSEMVHLPPARVSQRGGAADDMDPAPMAHTSAPWPASL
ncbi:MAG: hypothetical protein F4046_07155 [Acidimicrobiaceae bacterium]|nr:hypothetical protein [Acidimicrobiaceae bacterium]